METNTSGKVGQIVAEVNFHPGAFESLTKPVKTVQAYQKAVELSKAAHKAGFDGWPAESLGIKHELLELQYLRGAVLSAHGEAAERAAGTIQALEAAVKVMSVALDNLVGACMSEDGKPKQPDRRDLMKARAMLPAFCKHTLTKQVQA